MVVESIPIFEIRIRTNIQEQEWISNRRDNSAREKYS